MPCGTRFLPAHTMPDSAPLSTAKRPVLGAGDKPPALLGRFELLQVLGRGAQATTWLAFDPRLQRQVAIKLMHPVQDQDAALLEHWLREARHVGALAHPLIVPVFEAGVQGRQPYIVFEYVPGRTLAEHLAQQGRCAPHDAVALVADVLDGLQAAHAAGIVHRDLKPSSVMVDNQRHAHIERMRELTTQRRKAPLATKLLIDHAIFHIEADLRWIDLTSSRLTKLKEELCL